MENKIKNIKNNEKKLKENLNEKDLLLSELGSLLIKNNISFPDDENTARLVNDLELEIKKIKSELEKIKQYRKRITAINTDEKNALKKVREINGENDKHFIGIGETVFAVYLERPDELTELRPYMDELLDLNEKIDEIDEKIESGERKKDAEGFFGKIIVSGTGTVLESRKKLLESRFVNQYRDLGKKLCSERYFEKTRDKEIQGIFSAYEANLKVVEDLQIKIESLVAERSNYQNEIEDKEKLLKDDYNKKPDDAVEDREAELKGILLSAGRDFFNALNEEDGRVRIDNSDISDCLKKIEEIELDMEKIRLETDNLRKEMEIGNKQAELEKLKESVQNRQDKIKSIKKEIDKMNRTARKIEKEIEELSDN